MMNGVSLQGLVDHYPVYTNLLNLATLAFCLGLQINQQRLDTDPLRSLDKLLESDSEARRVANAGLPPRTETERMPPSTSATLAAANSDVPPLLTALERRSSCATATPWPNDVRDILGSADDVDGPKSYAAFT